MTLDEAKESLAIFRDTEQFLLREIGGSGKLTLANLDRWVDDLRQCREFIANMEKAVSALERGGEQRTATQERGEGHPS